MCCSWEPRRARTEYLFLKYLPSPKGQQQPQGASRSLLGGALCNDGIIIPKYLAPRHQGASSQNLLWPVDRQLEMWISYTPHAKLIFYRTLHAKLIFYRTLHSLQTQRKHRNVCCSWEPRRARTEYSFPKYLALPVPGCVDRHLEMWISYTSHAKVIFYRTLHAKLIFHRTLHSTLNTLQTQRKHRNVCVAVGNRAVQGRNTCSSNICLAPRCSDSPRARRGLFWEARCATTEYLFHKC